MRKEDKKRGSIVQLIISTWSRQVLWQVTMNIFKQISYINLVRFQFSMLQIILLWKEKYWMKIKGRWRFSSIAKNACDRKKWRFQCEKNVWLSIRIVCLLNNSNFWTSLLILMRCHLLLLLLLLLLYLVCLTSRYELKIHNMPSNHFHLLFSSISLFTKFFFLNTNLTENNRDSVNGKVHCTLCKRHLND